MSATIKLKAEVYAKLTRLRAKLELKDGIRRTYADAVEYLVENYQDP